MRLDLAQMNVPENLWYQWFPLTTYSRGPCLWASSPGEETNLKAPDTWGYTQCPSSFFTAPQHRS